MLHNATVKKDAIMSGFYEKPVSTEEVLKFLGCARSTLSNYKKTPGFPKEITRNRWLLSELKKWREARININNTVDLDAKKRQLEREVNQACYDMLMAKAGEYRLLLAAA